MTDFDVDAAASWLANEEPRWSGESGAAEMKRLLLRALDELRFTRHLLGLAQRALRSRDDVEMDAVLAQIFCAVGEVGTPSD